MIRAIILTLLLGIGVAAQRQAPIFEYSAHPDVTNNFAEASFACVFPRERPVAILVLAGGTDSDSRSWIRDPAWRALAEKERLVLIGACLRGAGEAYEVASGGSGQALLDAIAVLAKQSGQPEMGRLPLILYGHSAGAQFAFHFACWKPERVRAIVCVKSGPLPEPPQGNIPPFPALFIVGELDEPGRVREVARSFAAGRSLGAPWCLAFQPNAGHGSEGCRDLAEAFIGAADFAKPESASYAELTGSDNPRAGTTTTARNPNWSWLPNASFARAWRTFVKGVSVERLLTLPEELPPKQLVWRAITALPERVEASKEHVKFEYAISIPGAPTTIKEAKVTASSPVIATAVKSRSDQEWRVTGECDLRRLPLGPFKSQLQVELLTATGDREHGDFPLFTRITGPVSAAPSSLYYGVIARGAKATFEITIRAEEPHSIRNCEAVSSDPGFLTVALSPTGRSREYRALCTIHSGTRIGARNGQVTFRIETDRHYAVTVPFYGFVKK